MLSKTVILPFCLFFFFINLSLFSQKELTASLYEKLNSKQNYLSAEEYFTNKADFVLAEQLFREVYKELSRDDMPEKAFVGLRLAFTLCKLRKSDEALILLDKIEKYLPTEGKEYQLLLADLYTYRAYAYSRKVADKEALKWNEKAMVIKEKYYPDLHPKLGESYAVFTYVYNYFIKNMDLTGKYLQLENEVIAKHPEAYPKYEQVALHYNSASYFSKQGQFLKAITHGRKAIELIEPFKELYPGYFANCYTLLGNVYLRMEDAESAIKYIGEALKLKITMNNASDIALAYTNMGYAYFLKGDFKEATKNYQTAMSYYSERDTFHLPYSRIKMAEHYLSYPNIESQKEVLDSAYYNIKEAIRLYKNKYKQPNVNFAVPYGELATYYHFIEDLDSALYYRHLTLINSMSNFTDSSLYSQPSITDCIHGYSSEVMLINKSHASFALAKKNNDTVPLSHALSINDLLDSLYVIKKKYSLDEYSIINHPNIQKNYGLILETLYYANQKSPKREYIQQIFDYMERVKGNILLRNLSNLQQSKLFGVPDSLILKGKITAYAINKYLRLHPNRVENKQSIPVNSNDSLFQLLQEKDQLEKDFQKNYPQYYQVRFQAPDLSISKVKEKLNHHSLLEFYWTENALFALFISDTEPQIYRIPVDARLSYAIESHVQFLKNHSNEGFVDFKENAYELYTKLLGPLFQKEIPKKLIIIPDGPLAAISFETLLTSKSDLTSVNYRDLPYLLHKTAISYAYSANTLFQAYDKSSILDDPSLLAFSFSDKTSSPIANAILSENNLSPLANAAIETEHLEKLFSPKDFKAYFGKEATKANFFKHYKRFDIIHLALHAQSDYRNLFNNKIFFHPEKIDDAPENYICFAQEFYDLKPPPRLVTIGACNSGAGTNYAGEGTYSIARGFIYAGTPSVAMSLWPLSDQASKLVNDGFYERILKGVPLDEALQQAKQSFITSSDEWTAHPSRWAALNIVGSTKPLVSTSPSYFKWIFGGILLFSFLAVFKFYHNRDKN